MHGKAVTPADEFDGTLLERVIACTDAQVEVWLADRLSREASLAFNESVQLRLTGALDLAALRSAIDALVARHESLRASVGPEGVELLIGVAAPVDLAVVDLEELAPAAADAALQRERERAVTTPFVLESGPLFRALLLREAHDRHVLLMTAHHIVCDGWSWGVLVRDLGALYAEGVGEAPAPDAPTPFAEYGKWAAADAASPQWRTHEDYWLGRFGDGAAPVLDLPADRCRPAVRRFESRRLDRNVPAATVTAVRSLGARHGASLYAALVACFAATLGRIAGQSDVVVGVPSAGQAASGLTGVVGHCVNFLPVRVGVELGQPFSALLRATATHLLDAFEHQSLTYGALLRKLPVARDPSRLPLVSVMFNLDQALHDGPELFPGLHMGFEGNPRQFENFELFVNAVQLREGLRLEVQYATALFDESTVARWLDLFEQLLLAAAAAPESAVGALDWLGSARRAELAAMQPGAVAVPAGARMHDAFLAQAAATPMRLALVADAQRLSYAELDRRSNRLARTLQARGVRRGARVGLCLDRGADLLTAVLAVLKAGAAYVPLDPGFPAARLAYYAEDAALALLVTESHQAQAPRGWCADAAARVFELDADQAWLAGDDTALPDDDGSARPADPAYVIYTSGSTGRPKGVAVPHGAVANFLVGMRAAPGLHADDRLAAVTTLSFDIAVLELMLPLAVGAAVVLVPREEVVDAGLLRARLEASGATVMQATPGLWRNLLEAGWAGGTGLRAFVGGESFPADLAHALLARCDEVWNLYGPTETTIWSTAWRVDGAALAAHGMTIGRPTANTQVWVLDDGLQPCPVGVAGEICIGGAGVAIGYFERPELTAERFVSDLFRAGQRIYRTGDRGRWRSDGLIEHLGRLDFQVKVRGYRIELGEIESHCLARPGVADAVVLAREDVPGDVRLVAYLVPQRGAIVDATALRSALALHLPEYMVPQHLVVLEALPRLPNGKTDRRALPAPVPQAEPTATRRLPADAVEAAVLAAMESVLSLPQLSTDDDFFALGGHSLLAARLTARLGREFDIRLPLRTLFEARTAQTLAQAVRRACEERRPTQEPLRHDPAARRAALTPQQERIRFVEELHPGRVVYNTPSGHRLRGPLDLALFEAALREIVRRQPVLRTRIGFDRDAGIPVQEVLEAVEFDLPRFDLSAVPPGEQETVLLARMQAVVDTPIPLDGAPLFRTALYRLGPDHHAFLFMPHHIVWDGWSFDLLYEELAAVYGAMAAGQVVPRAAPSVTYLDYARWLAHWLEGAEAAEQLAWWRGRFAAHSGLRGLQPDFAVGRAGMSGEGASEWVRVDRSLTERLRVVARRADATLNMLAMTVYAAMLCAETGAAAIVLGIPVRGRQQAELEPVMGFFNNLLPFRVATLPQEAIVDAVVRIKADLLDAMAHQDLPFERMTADPEISASIGRAEPYHALFSFQDARGRTRRWGEAEQSGILLFQKGATEDLGLWLMEVPQGLEGAVTYNASLYSASTAALLRDRFVELLGRVADAPSSRLDALLDPSGSPIAAALQARSAPATSAVAPLRAAPVAAPMLEGAAARLAGIWAEVLGIEVSQIRASDNFFDLGGSSLLAMRAIEQASTVFGERIDARRYLSEPLVRLADGLVEARAPVAEGGVFRRILSTWRGRGVG